MRSVAVQAISDGWQQYEQHYEQQYEQQQQQQQQLQTESGCSSERMLIRDELNLLNVGVLIDWPPLSDVPHIFHTTVSSGSCGSTDRSCLF